MIPRPRLAPPVNFEVFTYPMRRRIPTVNVAVAMTVPTIQRTSLVSRFAIPVRCSVRSSAICVESRASEVGNLGPHFGETGPELIGGDVVALFEALLVDVLHPGLT